MGIFFCNPLDLLYDLVPALSILFLIGGMVRKSTPFTSEPSGTQGFS